MTAQTDRSVEGAKMDEGARIPIDISEEVAQASVAEAPIQRTTVKEDGTIVIDILVRQECAPSVDGEIVVCAEAVGSHRVEKYTPTPEGQVLADKIGEALNAKIGPLQVGSIAKGDGTRAFGAQLKF